MTSAKVGTAFAFITLPKRSVTAAKVAHNGTAEDLDARRTTIIKTRRSRSNNNKRPVSGYLI
jgi:hypothetical protein